MISTYMTTNVSVYADTMGTYVSRNQMYNMDSSITIEYYNQEIKSIAKIPEIKVYNTSHATNQQKTYNNAKYTKYRHNPTFTSEQENMDFMFGNDVSAFGMESTSSLVLISKFQPYVGDYFIPEQQNNFVYEVTNVDTNPQYDNNLNMYKIEYRLTEIGNKQLFLDSITILSEEYFSSFYNNYYDIDTYPHHLTIVKNKRLIEQFISNDDTLTSIFNQRTSRYLLPYVPNSTEQTLSEYYAGLNDDIVICDNLTLKTFIWFELSSSKDIYD